MSALLADAASVRAAIEHTLLAADATPVQIDALCDAATLHALGGVCVNPIHVARCAARLHGRNVRVVSVVGFPLGASRFEVKARECELAIADGADEIDTVIALGALRAGDARAVNADIRAVVTAAGGHPVKVILETGLLDHAQKERACELAIAAGAAFVKTCSGFAPGAATVADVELLRTVTAGRVGIKASAGVRSAAQARALMAAGAARIGTSSGAQIAAELAAEVQ